MIALCECGHSEEAHDDLWWDGTMPCLSGECCCDEYEEVFEIKETPHETN